LLNLQLRSGLVVRDSRQSSLGRTGAGSVSSSTASLSGCVVFDLSVDVVIVLHRGF
jgi:hypothetical protein